MSSVTSFNSLSGIIPSELNYTFKSAEELNESSTLFSNGLAYNRYSILSNLQDAVISKNNVFFLTDSITLSSALKEQRTTFNISSIPSLVYLKQTNGNLYFNLDGNDAVGSSDTKVPLFVAQVGDNEVELHTSKNYKLEVSSSYPYRVYNSRKATTEDQLARQRFTIDVVNNELTIKVITSEGSRFLAFDCFSKLKATGLIMNNEEKNDYIFTVEPISRTELTKGSLFRMEQIKYYNQFESFGNKKNVFVQDSEFANTHWLVTTTIDQLANNTDNVAVNIMPLKTNFTPAGTFLTNPNE